MVPIAIYIVLGLMGLGLLSIVAFGIRSLTFGKVQPMTIAFIAFPLVVLIVLGLAMPSWAEAGIMTILITLGFALLALLYTGIKGLFS